MRTSSEVSRHSLGLVIIGRNEGERLRRCLESVRDRAGAVVYVDSGSTDGSVTMAGAAGANVLRLDMSRPFTAARARNEGVQRLLALRPGVEFVQFVDGDCELVDGWLEAATRFLRLNPGHAVVSGRVRERHPHRSIFNRLCDWEWDTPVGEAKSCGGNALMRVSALREVGGFRSSLIAGEEPELCVRLRAADWGIYRLGCEMVLHDAGMTRFAQWWRRTVRSGHAFAEGAWMHGAAPERHWLRETLRALVYGGLLPAALIFVSLTRTPWAFLGFGLYAVQVARLSRQPAGFERAFFLVLGRFPECWGALRFYFGRLRGAGSKLIEYK